MQNSVCIMTKEASGKGMRPIVSPHAHYSHSLCLDPTDCLICIDILKYYFVIT